MVDQIKLFDIPGAVREGFAFGTQQRQLREGEQKQSALAQLASQAYGTQGSDRQALVQQAIATDPQSGFALGENLQSDEDRRNKTMVNMARMLTTAPEQLRPGLYASMVPTLRNFGLSELPEAYTPESAPIIEQAAQSIASAWDPQKATEGRVVGNALVNPVTGEVMYKGEAAPTPAQIINVPDGANGTVQMIFDPRTRQISQPQYPGSPSAGLDQPGFGALNPAADFQQLASLPGVQVSSLFRSPERNSQVGGVANSQHMAGTAGDFVVPPEQKQAFIQQARARGYEAIDEGDHVHVELPPGARAAGRFGAGQGLGYTPPKSSTDQPSVLAERLRIAREMGATPEQLQKMVLGETGRGRPTATQMRQANVAKTKLNDLTAIRNQLNTVRERFQPLRNSYSAGGIFGVGGNLVPSEEGERFDAAVDLLRTFVRKLTRTPGEGAMSDWEGRLANLANPSRGDREVVTEDKIAQLEALVDSLEQGYSAVLQDNAPSPVTPQASPATPGDWSIEEVR